MPDHHFPEPYKVGQYYPVTLIRAEYAERKAQWYPVLGPLHSDARALEFPNLHYHLDFRFAQPWIPWRLVMGLPINAYMITPEGQSKKPIDEINICTITSRSDRLAMANRHVKEFLARFPVESWQRPGQRKCKRLVRNVRSNDINHPQYVGIDTIKVLADRIKECIPESKNWRIDPKNPVCPHKGTCLKGLPVRRLNTTDYVECPLHGLRWDVRTGELL